MLRKLSPRPGRREFDRVYAEIFWECLKQRGLRFFSGVPDSTLRGLHEAMLRDSTIRYVPAVREDVALGVASAAYFAGTLGCVMMQNSGIGNIVNGLSSFSLIYRVPVLLIIGWRGYGRPHSDAQEHWVMGTKTKEFFELFDIPHAILDVQKTESTLDSLLDSMAVHSVPAALLVRPGLFQ